jgi:hypothetical protein
MYRIIVKNAIGFSKFLSTAIFHDSMYELAIFLDEEAKKVKNRPASNKKYAIREMTCRNYPKWKRCADSYGKKSWVLRFLKLRCWIRGWGK